MNEANENSLKTLSCGVSDDGKVAKLEFETYGGQKFPILMDTNSISRTVEALLNVAVKSGETFAHQHERVENVNALPIPTSAVGVGKGRTDREALIVFQVGLLQITFATELGTLIQICKDLQKLTTAIPPSKIQ